MTLIVHIGVLLKLCKFREDIGSLNDQDVQDKMCPWICKDLCKWCCHMLDISKIHQTQWGGKDFKQW